MFLSEAVGTSVVEAVVVKKYGTLLEMPRNLSIESSGTESSSARKVTEAFARV